MEEEDSCRTFLLLANMMGFLADTAFTEEDVDSGNNGCFGIGASGSGSGEKENMHSLKREE